jgi:uncharacterized membrane protein
MEAFLNGLQALDLHPVVDHFTIALLTLGVIIDLIASLMPTRAWIRYMALTLMVLGAICAGGSYATGDLESERVRKALTQDVRTVLDWHAEFGESVAVVFGVLALWRILVEATTGIAGSRPLYLLVALIAAGVLNYTGHLGGQLVYEHGVGTALMAKVAAASPAAPQASAVPNASLPMVSVPTPTPAQGAKAPEASPAKTPEAPPKAAESPEKAPATTPGEHSKPPG